MSDLLYSCMAKVTTSEGESLQYGPNWLLATRANLKIYKNHISYGNTIINYDQINEAILYTVKQYFIPGYVLKVVTDECTYHFGINSNRYWRSELPFEVKREKKRLGYTKFSLIVRIIVVGLLAYVILNKLGYLDGLWQ